MAAKRPKLAAPAKSGMPCPTCGGSPCRVSYTRHRGAVTIRVRRCPQGHRFPTREVPVGENDSIRVRTLNTAVLSLLRILRRDPLLDPGLVKLLSEDDR